MTGILISPILFNASYQTGKINAFKYMISENNAEITKLQKDNSFNVIISPKEINIWSPFGKSLKGTYSAIEFKNGEKISNLEKRNSWLEYEIKEASRKRIFGF